ncbi:SsgA family sporulation/cell division regulator [Streptomyces sp. NPDC091271]|uniref:SsgA family sporulation/cell division regulator n=1 Tax=Streptomyces sp. NPDC091271 TaxID=3365980 RepID=UPI00380F3394
MQPIQHVVTAQVSTPGHAGGQLTVWLRHQPDDPLAVRLDFAPWGGARESTATWVFARSLLIEGVTAPVGGGDVRVRPGGAQETEVELRSARGHCVVRFRTAALRSFFARTEPWPLQVAAQVESDLDRLLDGILRHA